MVSSKTKQQLKQGAMYLLALIVLVYVAKFIIRTYKNKQLSNSMQLKRAQYKAMITKKILKEKYNNNNANAMFPAVASVNASSIYTGPRENTPATVDQFITYPSWSHGGPF